LNRSVKESEKQSKHPPQTNPRQPRKGTTTKKLWIENREQSQQTTTQEATTNQENGEGGELIGMAGNQQSRPLQRRRPSKRTATGKDLRWLPEKMGLRVSTGIKVVRSKETKLDLIRRWTLLFKKWTPLGYFMTTTYHPYTIFFRGLNMLPIPTIVAHFGFSLAIVFVWY
ncbi:hypothetical protein A2U01_0034203, partial [Trifolium medium]|nr:hypothetical protein [Trifolium medium]